MNTTAKGRRVENLAKQYLEGEGWIVDSKPRTRFHSPDIFGYFDLVAIYRGATIFVQIKSHVTDFYQARKRIGKWLSDKDLCITAQVWLRTEGSWRREEYTHTFGWRRI